MAPGLSQEAAEALERLRNWNPDEDDEDNDDNGADEEANEDDEKEAEETVEPVEPTYEPTFAPGGAARRFLEGQESAARIRLDVSGDAGEFAETLAHGLAEEVLGALWAPFAPAPNPESAVKYTESQRKAQAAVRQQMQGVDGATKARACAMAVVDSARDIHEHGILRHRFNDPEAAVRAIKKVRAAKRKTSKKTIRNVRTNSGYAVDFECSLVERIKKVVVALRNKHIAKDVLNDNAFANIDDLTLSPDQYLRRKLSNSKDNFNRLQGKRQTAEGDPSASGEQQTSLGRSSLNNFPPFNPEPQPGPDGSFYHLAAPRRDEESLEPVVASGSGNRRKRSSAEDSGPGLSKRMRIEGMPGDGNIVDDTVGEQTLDELFWERPRNEATTAHVDPAFADAMGRTSQQSAYSSTDAPTTSEPAMFQFPRGRSKQEIQQEPQQLQAPAPQQIQPVAHPPSFLHPHPVQQVLRTRFQRELREIRENQQLRSQQRTRALQHWLSQRRISVDRQQRAHQQMATQLQGREQAEVRYLQHLQAQMQGKFDREMQAARAARAARSSGVTQTSQTEHAHSAQENNEVEADSDGSSSSSGLFVSQPKQEAAGTTSPAEAGIEVGRAHGNDTPATEALPDTSGPEALESPENSTASTQQPRNQTFQGLNANSQSDSPSQTGDDPTYDLSVPDFAQQGDDVFNPDAFEDFGDIFSNL